MGFRRQQMFFDSGVAAVSNGSEEWACAATTAGGVKSCGSARRGQLGSGTTSDVTSSYELPVPLASAIRWYRADQRPTSMGVERKHPLRIPQQGLCRPAADLLTK